MRVTRKILDYHVKEINTACKGSKVLELFYDRQDGFILSVNGDRVYPRNRSARIDTRSMYFYLWGAFDFTNVFFEDKGVK